MLRWLLAVAIYTVLGGGALGMIQLLLDRAIVFPMEKLYWLLNMRNMVLTMIFLSFITFALWNLLMSSHLMGRYTTYRIAGPVINWILIIFNFILWAALFIYYFTAPNVEWLCLQGMGYISIYGLTLLVPIAFIIASRLCAPNSVITLFRLYYKIRCKLHLG